RGSGEDVLARYYEAARESGAEVIVRVTSACPLIDAAVIDRVIRTYKENIDKVDYVANTLVRSYPRGMDCEVFPFAVLADIHERTFEPVDREHVTAYIYNHPDRFRLLNVAGEENLSHHRWTVDTPEDFELIRRMIEALYPVKHDFSMGDCLDLLKHNPEWLKLNQHIKQKA
ncbi:MAG: acylneuraminate cytidylyltransferase, partial [candidate division Zixibacteria bacterium]|nr:acylneuraminate cytidylyltransferase [candidate division Zixibacteria bacterium]